MKKASFHLRHLATRWFLALFLILGSSYFFFSYIDFDWWLYHVYAHRVERNSAEISVRLRNSGLFVKHLGNVSYDGETHQVDAVVVDRGSKQSRVCVYGGIHGNEPAGVEAAVSLVEDLAHSPQLYSQLNFVIVPLANPWGWAHDLRNNGNNMDVNRSFATGATPEAEIVKSLLRDLHCDLVADLHEDLINKGFYLLTYENPTPGAAQGIAGDIQKAGFSVRSGTNNGVFHVRQKEFPSLTRTTLSLYARQQGVKLTYIFETPIKLPMSDKVALHRLALDSMIHSLQ